MDDLVSLELGDDALPGRRPQVLGRVIGLTVHDVGQSVALIVALQAPPGLQPDHAGEHGASSSCQDGELLDRPFVDPSRGEEEDRDVREPVGDRELVAALDVAAR